MGVSPTGARSAHQHTKTYWWAMTIRQCGASIPGEWSMEDHFIHLHDESNTAVCKPGTLMRVGTNPLRETGRINEEHI